MSKTMRYCPFCNGEDTEIVPDGHGWIVGCLPCNYKIHVADCTEEEAIRFWNTRPAEDALKAENESLKEKVKSEKLTHISLGETITRASKAASYAKTDCVRLKEEVERLKEELDAQKSVSKIAHNDIEWLCKQVEKWKKMFYDLDDKQAKVSTEINDTITAPKKGGEDE